MTAEQLARATESVRVASARSLRLIAAMLAFTALAVVEAAVSQPFARAAGEGRELGAAVGVLMSLTFGMCLVLFSMWLHGAVSAAALLHAAPAWSPKAAVWSLFIPVLNLYRPLQVVSDLVRVLDPETLPDAPVYVEVQGGDYRSSARGVAAPPKWRHPIPARAWWALWVGGWFAGMLARRIDRDVGFVVDMVTLTLVGPLASLVVFGIDARMRERLRRLSALPGRAAG